MRRFGWWQSLVAVAAVAALAIQWLIGWAWAISAARNSVRKTLLRAGGELVVMLGGMATWWQLHINRESHITDRYTRAVEQLGADPVDVQLGGIYALERIAHDSPHDRPTITEVLTAFVRHWAKPLPESEQGHDDPAEPESEQSRDDLAERLQIRLPAVEAAMSVLGRMLRPDDVRLELANLDLRRADLAGANLTRIHLVGANLTGADLQGATLTGADLAGANLTRARLGRANLTEAHLQGATLADAYVTSANLTRADLWLATLTGAVLEGAILTGAVLEGATLTGAVLEGATLTGANLGSVDLSNADLAGANLTRAKFNTKTRWPEGFGPVTAGAIELNDDTGEGDG